MTLFYNSWRTGRNKRGGELGKEEEKSPKLYALIEWLFKHSYGGNASQEVLVHEVLRQDHVISMCVIQGQELRGVFPPFLSITPFLFPVDKICKYEGDPTATLMLPARILFGGPTKPVSQHKVSYLLRNRFRFGFPVYFYWAI